MATSTILISIFYLRILAGMIDNTLDVKTAPMVSFALLLFLGFALVWRSRVPRPLIGTVLAIFGMVVAALISYLFNDVANPQSALSYILVTILYALLVASGARVFGSPQGTLSLFWFCQILILVGATASIYQSLSGSGLASQVDPSLIRGFGTAAHPVAFGMQSVITFVLAEICRIRLQREINGMYILCLLIGLVGVYFTFARTAWLMLIIVALAYGFFAVGGRNRLVALFVGMLLLIGLVVVSGRFADLVDLPAFLANTAFDAERFDSRSVHNSMSWRVTNWVLHFRMGWESPLIGFGPGQSRDVSLFGLEMHNMFLEVFIEIGILGLAALAIFLWQLLRLHHRYFYDGTTSRHSFALISGLSLGLLVSACFSVGFLDQTIGMLLYLLVVTVPLFPVIPNEICTGADADADDPTEIVRAPRH